MRFITVPYLSLLKIKWRVRENKRGFTEGGEPMRDQFGIWDGVDERLQSIS